MNLVPVIDLLKENRKHKIVPHHPTDEEYEMIGRSVPIVCTDLVFVDEQNRFVLAYRRNACARGWWWMGGSLKAGMTFKESIAKIMMREIGFMVPNVELLCVLPHFWSERGEKPREFGRHDILFIHMAQVDEYTIAKIRLNPKEYESGRGLMRYNGTQDVRSAVSVAYKFFKEFAY